MGSDKPDPGQGNPAQQQIDRVAEQLSASSRILVVTGAGMSAESGLPTYRGSGGIYDVADTEEGIPIEEALSASVFRTHPEITWKYLGQIIEAGRGKQFNLGHRVLSDMEASGEFESLWVLTQNVDGFHADAGTRQLIEIHGNIHSVTCTTCQRQQPLAERTSLPPRCDHCQAIMRPDVVLFDEMLPLRAQQQLAEVWRDGFNVVISIGTTAVFPYIAEPMLWAADQGLPTIEINPDATRVSHLARHQFRSPAAETLARIWQTYRSRRSSCSSRSEMA